jgi:hypothetical protein
MLDTLQFLDTLAKRSGLVIWEQRERYFLLSVRRPRFPRGHGLQLAAQTSTHASVSRLALKRVVKLAARYWTILVNIQMTLTHL